MDINEALTQALEVYEKKAKAAIEAQEQAKKAAAEAQQGADRLKKAEEDLKKALEERKGGIGKARKELAEAEKPEKASNAAKDKAETANKERHLAALAIQATHQPDEENGCVSRCVWSKAEPPTYRRRCLFEGHNHKENAIKYHVANDRAWYNLSFHRENSRARKRLDAQAKQIRLDMFSKQNNPIETPGAWDMSQAGPQFVASWRKPWKHEAHHIIAVDALYQAFKSNPEALGFLQQVKYNINKGINIIILPIRPAYGKIYLLPAHTNNHPKYNTEVEMRLSPVVRELSEEREQKKGHPETSDEENSKWKQALENHSKALRRELRRYGLRMGLDPTPKTSIALGDMF